MENRIKRRSLAILIAAALLSGCAPAEKPLSVSTAECSADAASGTSEPLVHTEQEIPGQTAEQSSEETEQPSPETAQTVPATEETSSEQVTLESPGESTEETSRADPEPPAQTTAATVQTTQPPETTTTTAAVPAEPVKVVIPDVRVPLSPGTETISEGAAVVDYSNSSDGYISVCWADSGKRVKLRLTYGDKVYDHDVSGGGVTEYFPISCGSGDYTIQLYEQTEGNKYRKALEQQITVQLKSDVAPFLYPNKYVDFSKKSDCVRKAAELCAGKTDEIERLAAIFQWITDNVTYDKQLAATVQSGYIPDPDRTLEKKTGICFDYASLMAAMARSQDIPTRLVIGYAADNIYHAWNEVYTSETGWITPELLLSRRGYNITDATFYAGSSDKEKIADYISNSGNYSALYYY